MGIRLIRPARPTRDPTTAISHRDFATIKTVEMTFVQVALHKSSLLHLGGKLSHPMPRGLAREPARDQFWAGLPVWIVGQIDWRR